MENPDMLQLYNEMSIEDKRQELAEEFMELIMVIKKIKADADIMVNEDNSDLRLLYDGNVNESIYLTYLYKNILNLKDELGEYLEKIADAFYE